MSPVRRLIAGAGLALALLGPSVALACPSCAGRNEGGISRSYLLGSMILLPFGVAGVVVAVIKRVQRDESEAKAP